MGETLCCCKVFEAVESKVKSRIDEVVPHTLLLTNSPLHCSYYFILKEHHTTELHHYSTTAYNRAAAPYCSSLQNYSTHKINSSLHNYSTSTHNK